MQIKTTRNRFFQLLLIAVTIALGLASRSLSAVLPAAAADAAGDILWALMFFWVFGLMLTQQPAWIIAFVTLLFSYSIEISQLYHAPFIDSIRATTLGGLLLGYNFVWTDLACYTIGVLTGVIAENFFCFAGNKVFFQIELLMDSHSLRHYFTHTL